MQSAGKRRARALIVSIGVSIAVAACASYERAETANRAQTEMRGLTKSDVLGCMGPPVQKASEGNVEVWSYHSGGELTGSTFATADASGRIVAGTAISNAKVRQCAVNVVFNDGHVSRLNYIGRTGGLFTRGEQCAYAVENCVKR